MRTAVSGTLLFLALATFSPHASAQVLGETIDVRVINVDVVVTGRDGARLSGLTREQFRLYEDGKPVEIAYFSRYAESGGQAPPPVVAAETTNDIRLPVTWAVLIDQTSMRPSARNQALQQLRAFLDSAVTSGDRAMLTIVDGQAFRVAQNITTDRSRLMTALQLAEKESVHHGPSTTEAASLRREITWADTNDPEIRTLARSIGMRITSLMKQEARRTQNAFAASRALLQMLGTVDGRVALLYVGSGFTTLPGTELAEAWRQAFSHVQGLGHYDVPHPEDYEASLEQEVEDLYSMLTASRVTVYSIHPGESTVPAADDPGLVIAQQTVQGSRAAEGEVFGGRGDFRQASLSREIALYTGGRMFRANPQLANQLIAVRNDFNDYYSLGYVPRGEAAKTRRIRVEVDVPGSRVRHRTAVRERSRVEEAEIRVLTTPVQARRNVVPSPLTIGRREASAAATADSNPFGIAVAVDALRDRDLPIRMTTRIDTLSFRRTDRAMRADLVFHFALATPNGTLWPIESREQALEIPLNEVPSSKDVMSSSWQLDLAPLQIPESIPIPRQANLTILVVDRTSQLRSTVTVPVAKR